MTTPHSLAPPRADRRLREVVAVHFDPEDGTPFWLERALRLGLDPRSEITTLQDLPKLGLMEPGVLASRPLTDFVPRSVLREPEHLIVAQTGGTLGRPAWTAYTDDEFHEAFVEPFLVAAGHVGFPRGGTWLYIGPSGPHVIRRAADALARHTSSPAPFTVDFDSRWAKKLAPGSFAAGRYLDHVIEQALDLIDQQAVTILFTTPVLLRALAEKMSVSQRERIRGVHYAGMAIEPDRMQWFQTEGFPNAVHLSGYGNTLFGCCLELDTSPGRELRYYPHGDRLVFNTIAGTDSAATLAPRPRTGQAGRLVFTRLDRTMLLVNCVERDQARLVETPAHAPEGYSHLGVEAPAPGPAEAKEIPIALY